MPKTPGVRATHGVAAAAAVDPGSGEAFAADTDVASASSAKTPEMAARIPP